MNTKTKVIAAVVLVVVAGAAFYGGTVYAKGSAGGRSSFAAGQFSRTGTSTGTFTARGGANGGFTSGQILSVGNGSITVQGTDGSSKIILIGDSTQISKMATGSMSDLTAGTNVTITGTTNSDGSITATMVDIRPAGSNAPMIRANASASTSQ